MVYTISKKNILIHTIALLFIASIVYMPAVLAAPKPVPRMQVIPLPYHQASFQRDGLEIARYHFDSSLHRPFIYPVIGPSGRCLTRMGHPHDPESHSHHNSVWISHNDVDGISFWSDGGKGKIRHERIIKFEDGDQTCSITIENSWLVGTNKALLSETRKVTVMSLEDSEWLMIIDIELKANDKPLTLGKTPFGMIGVRMAKTIGVNDGGGTIRNSEGAVNEKEVFWKRARWVDYSGVITKINSEGITLFDHPENPNFPSYFHVRNDGWMGASLTFDGPRTIQPDKPLHLRYGLYIHSEIKPANIIDAKWKQFSRIELSNFGNLSKNK